MVVALDHAVVHQYLHGFPHHRVLVIHIQQFGGAGDLGQGPEQGRQALRRLIAQDGLHAVEVELAVVALLHHGGSHQARFVHLHQGIEVIIRGHHVSEGEDAFYLLPVLEQ